MKIMFYTMGMSKGGTERNISLLSNDLINNYEVIIVTNNNMDSSYNLDNRVNHIKIDNNNHHLINKFSNKRTKKLLKIIKEEKPNLIISMLPEPSIRILKIKDKIDIPVIISVRNHPKYEFRYLKLLRNYYYKKADLIIVQSSKYFKYFPFSNIEEIPNYLDDSFINYQGNSQKENIIISVARLSKQKNIPLLIKTFKKIDNKDYKLYIYGKGNQELKINKMIKRYHLQNRVYLKGNVNNIQDELVKSKLFILTSIYEGMPNALLEALSLKIPSISTNSSEVLEDIIINNKNGFIVNSKKELINKINYLLNNNDLLNKFSKNNYYIKKKYNKSKIIKKWYNVIEKYAKR